MKQYSLYERHVRRMQTRDRLLSDIMEAMPAAGQIAVYELPDGVHEAQIILLGKDAAKKTFRKPRIIVL